MANRYDAEYSDPFDVKSEEQFAALDINEPTKQVYNAADFESPLQIAAVQAGITGEVVNSLSAFMRTSMNLTPEQVTSLERLTNKSFLANKQLQQLASDSYDRVSAAAIPTRELQISLPDWGDTDSLETSALKLLQIFDGDSSDDLANCDALRLFLTDLYDQARNKITELACRSALLKRLGGSAKDLVSRFIQESADPTTGIVPADQPPIVNIVQYLEDVYFACNTPELAVARLDCLVREKNETFSHLESRISNLCKIAALSQPRAQRILFIKEKEMLTFKRCLTTFEREVMNQSEQSRRSTGLPGYTLQQAVNYLIHYNAQKATFAELKKVTTTAKTTPPKPPPSEDDTLKFFDSGGGRGRGFRGGRFNRFRRGRGNRGFRPFQGRGLQRGNPGGPPRGNQRSTFRGGRVNRGPPRQQRFNYRGGNNRPYNNYNNGRDNNLDVTPCLKCEDPQHSTSQRGKCIYRNSPITRSKCPHCRVGRHPARDCVGQNYLGANNPSANINQQTGLLPYQQQEAYNNPNAYRSPYPDYSDWKERVNKFNQQDTSQYTLPKN